MLMLLPISLATSITFTPGDTVIHPHMQTISVPQQCHNGYRYEEPIIYSQICQTRYHIADTVSERHQRVLEVLQAPGLTDSHGRLRPRIWQLFYDKVGVRQSHPPDAEMSREGTLLLNVLPFEKRKNWYELFRHKCLRDRLNNFDSSRNEN